MGRKLVSLSSSLFMLLTEVQLCHVGFHNQVINSPVLPVAGATPFRPMTNEIDLPPQRA